MSQSLYSTTVALDRGALLEDVRPAVTALAKRFSYRVAFYVHIEVDDLSQEGMIGAWQASQRLDPAYSYEQARSYCIRSAFHSIIDVIKQENRSKAGSLEAYLAPRAGEDGPVRELADRPGVQIVSPVALRRSVLRMLWSCLTENQALAVMADFNIDVPKTGKVVTREQVEKRLGIGAGTYRQLRSRGMLRLRALAHNESLMNAHAGNRLSGERIEA